jgi:hypothetical protein
MYEKNFQRGESLRVVPAELAHPDGIQHGVAIFAGHYLMAAVTADHAWKLADALADVIDGLPAA